ncbi:hypothetical protein [Gimesia algae]|uniref:Uncharacterized protein n=1 Tax=Gimesia algae TaxID=2527971 RepID=A0A517VI75_9PLAN|nr:hypothetical protein [Gimesia algae]QDT92710.1 hypothetical protein Pan161_43800 [Gimesia algae]
MALHEQDREDLMREATALFPRAEFQVELPEAPLFWGQKKNGHFAFYFGSDPVYQFDQNAELRRAFIDGKIYRTQGSTLARLTRVHNSAESILQRYDLTETELKACLQAMTQRFQQLDLVWLDPQKVQMVQSLAECSDLDLRNLIHKQIRQVLQHSQQLAPRIRGKR